jgi:hypothetical protein
MSQVPAWAVYAAVIIGIAGMAASALCGFDAGQSAAQISHRAMLDACLAKELNSLGYAGCDDPNFQARIVNPNGLKFIVYFGDSPDSLNTVSNHVLFGWPELDDGASNFIFRHLAPEGVPIEGTIEGSGSLIILPTVGTDDRIGPLW